MVAAWMLYTLALGFLGLAGALLVERLVRLFGLPSRRVWLAAMTGAVAFPVLGLAGVGPSVPSPTSGHVGAIVAPVVAAASESTFLLRELDEPLLAVWGVATGLLGLYLAVSAAVSAVGRRRWKRARLDGVPVYLSEDVGPAVVGVVRARIVFPRWALGLERPLRDLVLRHEEEHLHGRDPQALLLAALLLVLMPWNLSLWAMLHRFRLAVEVDCDRRVLSRLGCDVRTYGHLLIRVGGRRSGVAFPAPAFSRSRSLLEHRIDHMTRRPGNRGVRVAALLGGAFLVGGLALLLPHPVAAVTAAEHYGMCEATPPSAQPAPDALPREVLGRPPAP